MEYGYYPAQPQAYPFSAFPPTPTHSYEAHDDPMVDGQEAYAGANGFPNYDPAYQLAANSFLPQQPPAPATVLHHQQHTPPDSDHRHSITSSTAALDSAHSMRATATAADVEGTDANTGSRSDSEEKDAVTPQQDRRKAQNRAAQRAFRERKERHVKELETKLNSLSARSSMLLSENERMKKEMQRLSAQNEALRATQPPALRRSPSPVHGPQTYSPTDFVTAVGVDLHGRPISYDCFDGDGGQRLLATGATWDLIQSHHLYRRGMVDVTEVCRRLNGKAACDGRGPVFKELEVIRAIEESALSGSDELI